MLGGEQGHERAEAHRWRAPGGRPRAVARPAGSRCMRYLRAPIGFSEPGRAVALAVELLVGVALAVEVVGFVLVGVELRSSVTGSHEQGEAHRRRRALCTTRAGGRR